MTLSGTLVRLYEHASGAHATPRSSEAIAQFGPYLAGMIVAKGLSTLGQLLISRILGPAEFGHLAVALATANLLALPLAGAWGSALVRYSAGQPRVTWAPILRWAVQVTLGSVAIIAALVALTSPFVGPVLHVPPAILITGSVLGIGMALWLLAKSSSQAREDWTRFVGSELAWGVTVILAPWVIMSGTALTWIGGAAVFALAYVVGTLPAGRYFMAAFRSPSSASSEAPARTFGRFALLTGIANTIFLYADRFVAQHALGFREVGIYQVYSFATVGVAMLLSTMLNNFAFPLFPQGDRRAFGRLFGRTFVRVLPLTLLALFAAGALQVWLVHFPFRPVLLALATLDATAFTLAAFYGNLVLSQGVAGSRVSSRVSAASLAAFAAGSIPAVRSAGLAGLFILYTLIFLGVALVYRRALARLPDVGPQIAR